MTDDFHLTEEEGSDGVVERGVTRVVLDLSEASFLDSSALAVLLSARKRLAGQAGRLAVAGLSHDLKTTFRLTGLDQLFEIEDSREQAVRALNEGTAGL